MKKLVFLFVLLLAILSCKPKQVLQTTQTDSVRVEYRDSVREVVREVPVYIEVPGEVKQFVRADSSFIENKYASSKAFIQNDGYLFHDLILKPITLKKKATVKDTYQRKDSVIYISKLRKVEVPVPRELTRMQQWQIKLGNINLIQYLILMSYVGFKLYKRIQHPLK